MRNETQTSIDNLMIKQRQAEKRKQEKEEALRKCFAKALETPEGKCAFKYIKKISLWDKENRNVDQQVVSYLQGRRDNWLLIRQFLPREVLAQIEIFDDYDIELEE